jgi:N-acetylmuramoyl-L-alanine amidase
MKKCILMIWIFLVMLSAGCDKRSRRFALLAGDPSIKGFVTIEPDSVTMFTSPEDKKTGRIECRIYKNEYEVFIKMFSVLDQASLKNTYLGKGSSRFSEDFINKINVKIQTRGLLHTRPNTSKLLDGVRIAVDPGHIAGTFNEAIREGKFMWLMSPRGNSIKFYEAALNLATARVLKDMLERDGATVMLTRNSGRQVYPLSFDAWVLRYFRWAVNEKLREKHITREAAERLLNSTKEDEKLKFFNSEIEMPYRARLINDFHPDITVLVHYDAMDDNPAFRSKYLRIKNILSRNTVTCGQKIKEIEDVVKSISETGRDFCTVYVPGSFLRGELDSVESRIEFLRLIISPDIDHSILFSKYVLENFEKFLGVPPAHEPIANALLVSVCRHGLYARNFKMTRLVRGALCLGEPLQQNNMKEAIELSSINNGKVPERVKQVARAYYEAVLKYVKRHIRGAK